MSGREAREPRGLLPHWGLGYRQLCSLFGDVPTASITSSGFVACSVTTHALEKGCTCSKKKFESLCFAGVPKGPFRIGPAVERRSQAGFFYNARAAAFLPQNP